MSFPWTFPACRPNPTKTLGCNAVVRGSLFLQDVQIPETYLIGQEGKGFKLAMQGFDQSRILLLPGSPWLRPLYPLKRPWTMSNSARPSADHWRLSKAFLSRSLNTSVSWRRCGCCATRLCALRDQGRSSSKEAGMLKWMAPPFFNQCDQGLYRTAWPLWVHQRLSAGAAVEGCAGH